MAGETFKALLDIEQKFIFHWIREGCAIDKMVVVERKCRLKRGDGPQILRRRMVQEEIQRRRALVEFEEHKQIARDKSALAKEEDERERVTKNRADSVLDSVLGLDAKEHGATVLKAVELALVYCGAIRDGNKVRVIVEPDREGKAQDNLSSQFYRSIFQPAGAQEPAPLMPPGTEEKAHEVPPLKTMPHQPAAPPTPAATPAPAKKASGKAPMTIEIT